MKTNFKKIQIILFYYFRWFFSQYGILIFGPLLFLKLQLYLWKTCQKLNSTEFCQKDANFQFDKSLKIIKANKYF